MVARAITVEGAEQFYELARRLKEAGDKDLQRELYRGLNRAAKPLRAELKRSAIDVLPGEGEGLDKKISGSKFRLQRRTSSKGVGIKLVTTSSYDIGALDKGRARHPLFGNRRRWYLQPVLPGWWSQPTKDSAPAIREELIKVMDEVKRKIEG